MRDSVAIDFVKNKPAPALNSFPPMRLAHRYLMRQIKFGVMMESMKPALPISIPPEIAAKCDGTDQFQNFDRGVRLFLSVSKSAVLKDEAKAKRRKERAKKS